MTVYPTKVDWWMWPALGMPILGFAGIVATGPGPSLVLALGTLAVFAGLLAVFVLPMRYTVGPAGLGLRFGLMKSDIAWTDVKSIGLASDSALATDRVEIKYRRPAGNLATVRVSPVDRDAFLAESRRYFTKA